MIRYFSLFFLIIFSLVTITLFVNPQISQAENSNITEFQTGGGYASIVAGSDNKLWAIQADFFGRIWKLDLDGQGIAFSLPHSITSPLGMGITKGPDGNIWFTEMGANRVGKITSEGDITEFIIPTNNSRPYDITTGSDGNLWFTEEQGNKIGKITPNGTVTEYPLPREFNFQLSYPRGITPGPDGNIWFIEFGANKIGRITPNGLITEFRIPSGSSNGPEDIVTGVDGNLWFTEGGFDANKVGRITPEGVITEFNVPTSNSRPYSIISAHDGNLWFTEFSGNKIAKITLEGDITEFVVPSSNSQPAGITIGPDNNIWFTEANKARIGRVSLNSSITPTPIPTTMPSGNTLNVPYYSQNVEPWGPSEYDHTDDLGVGGLAGSMDRWGCAVTSVAMVLNYHNMKQFPNGTAIDPGSVNQWLKDNGGYSYGYGKDGWYSSIIWNKVSVLTQQLHAAGKAPYKLEWQRRYPNPASTTLLNSDLTEGNSLAKIPNILFVNNGHFIVAKGIIGDTYAVNDPEWNYPTLASFNNSYSQIDRFVPSHTDLSYIVAVVNPDVEILVTDSQGRKVGKTIQEGQTTSFSEIPGASYSYEPPIKNPNELGVEENLGTGVNTLLLPKPDEGKYTISLTGETQTNYTLNVTTFEIDGDNEIHKSEGLLAQGESNTLDIGYSQTQPSIVAIDVSFQSLINDVTELYALGHIAHQSVANSLVRNIGQAEKASLASDTNKVIQNLDQFISILERERGRKINERAFNILFENANNLKQEYSI